MVLNGVITDLQLVFRAIFSVRVQHCSAQFPSESPGFEAQLGWEPLALSHKVPSIMKQSTSLELVEGNISGSHPLYIHIYICIHIYIQWFNLNDFAPVAPWRNLPTLCCIPLCHGTKARRMGIPLTLNLDEIMPCPGVSVFKVVCD